MNTHLRTSLSIAFSVAALILLPALPGAAQPPKPSAIEGLVTDQADQPLRDVVITATRADDPSFRMTEKTSRKGRFTLRLEAGGGSYTLRFEKEGFDPYESPVDVEPGMVHDITFRMAPEGSGSQRQAAQAFNEGVAAYQAGDLAAAREKFLAVLEIDPELPQPHVYLADLYLKAGELEQAAQAIETYLPSDEGNATAWRLAFDVYRAQGSSERLAEAVARLKGTELAESLAVRTYNEGVEKSQKGNVEGALADFRLALELAPEMTAIHAGLAALLLNQGSYAEAAAAAEALLAVDPADVRGRRIRYLALAAQESAGGGDAGADAALAAWAEVDAEAAADLLYQQAEQAFKQDRREEAIRGLQAVLRIAPDMPRAHYTLGLAYTSAGDTAKAKQHLQRFLELAPEDPEAATARELIQGL